MSSIKTKKPSPKDIVLSLMTFVRRENRRALDKSTGQFVDKEYLLYRCPKPGCPTGVVSFLAKTGFKNPYSHLTRCYAKGQDPEAQEETMLRLFEAARDEDQKSGGTILSRFASNTLSEYEEAVYSYLRLVVLKNVPLCLVEDSEFRNFSKYDVRVSPKTMCQVIFNLVELVERRISDEMRGTRGAVLHGGWSINDTHYVAVIASYCTTTADRRCTNSSSMNVPRLTLLSLSPVGRVEENKGADSMDDGEASTFNAKARIQLFKDIFPVFGQDFEKWCLCCIADNTHTNVRVARLCGKPVIGCNSHKLDLEVNFMINSHSDLSRTIDSVHDTMRSAKKLRNAALVRKLTDFKPVMHDKTRWSGKLLMLQRFLQIRQELLEVSESRDGELHIESSGRFEGKVNKYKKMLGEINVVAKSLQTRGRTLSQCREDLDLLLEYVADEKSNANSPLYQCRLSKKYTAQHASIVAYPHFESGVVKIQRGLEGDLSEDEKESVSILLKAPQDPEQKQQQDDLPSTLTLSMSERLAKRRRTSSPIENYMNCEFLLGSVAEVERVFSIAKNVWTENRRSMSPQLFEALMFLKLNERFWNRELVSEAMKGGRLNRAQKRLNAHSIHEEHFDYAQF